MATRVKFPVVSARRIPDPNLTGATRHVLMVRAEDVPPDLPLDPNPRGQNIDRGVYRDVAESLLSLDGYFHLKNKGITILADGIREVDDTTYEVEFGDVHGIVDGGHTYRILLDHREDLLSSAEDDGALASQFAKFEILTGVPDDLYVDIAGGLNTAVQVQQMSLGNLAREFDWIKDALKGKPYEGAVAFRENEKAPYDARDLIVFLEMFNIFDYPPNNGGNHPTRAYNNKTEVLKSYRNDVDKYRRLGTILDDILRLHDTIAISGPEHHTAAGGKAGKLAFVEHRKRGNFDFQFISKESNQRLNRAALYPMLGAFRWLVTLRSDETVEWQGGFDHVLEVWSEAAAELMRATQTTCVEYKYKLTNLGKSPNHWATMFNIVARYDLTRRR